MKERLIQEFWQAKCAGNFHFISSDNSPILVSNFGELNVSQGPDFIGGQVRIGDMTFFGEIEIHVNSSDWEKHGHQFDEKYNSVILHVVWKNDKKIQTKMGNIIPTLELSSIFNEKDLQKLQIHNMQLEEFPCRSKMSDGNNEKIINEQLSVVFINRMARKFEKLESKLIALNGDWIQLVIQTSSDYWFSGMNREAVIFQNMHLKLRWLLTFTPQQLMAYFLYFGRENKIENSSLSEVYNELKLKYQINEINFPWYNGGVFPSSNVNLRLQQFAIWLCFLRKRDFVFNLSNGDKLNSFIYQFNQELARMNIQKLGSDFALKIKLNVLIPLSVFKEEHPIRLSSSKEVMDHLKFENNQITRKLRWLNDIPLTATTSQSILEQYKYFCKPHACLVCKIGKVLLSNGQ
jgi:hypothetical protein